MAKDPIVEDATTDIDWICTTLGSMLTQQKQIGKLEVMARRLQDIEDYEDIHVLSDINESIANRNQVLAMQIRDMLEVIVDAYDHPKMTTEQRCEFLSNTHGTYPLF